MSIRHLTFEDLGSVAQLRENYDVELKSAQGKKGTGEVPGSVWETYSAFANTKGGWIVLGVSEEGSGLEIAGIQQPSRLKKQIWDTLNNRQKVSRNILDNRDVRTIEERGEDIVVMRVPAANRKQRPVYVGTNPMVGTYIRNYEGDYLAGEETVRRMLAEAEIGARDSKVLPDFGLDDLSEDSLRRYRNLFQSRSPQHPFLEGSDKELLRRLGGMKLNRDDGSVELTVAGLLMFGELVRVPQSRATPPPKRTSHGRGS